jgi:hypothetical protein
VWALVDRLARASRATLPIVALALVSCVSYRVQPEDRNDLRTVESNLKVIQGELDAALDGARPHGQSVRARQGELAHFGGQIAESLARPELGPESAQTVRADLASYKKAAVQLVQTAMVSDAYPLTESQVHLLEKHLEGLAEAVVSIDGRLERYLADL